MQDHLQLAANRRTAERRRLAGHYVDQARLASLERVLGDCVQALADTFDGEPDNPEPPCSIEAKRLLGRSVG